MEMLCAVRYLGNAADRIAEERANAALIAEAPAMLEALRAILEWADPYDLPGGDRNVITDQLCNARAIIKRLGGRK